MRPADVVDEMLFVVERLVADVAGVRRLPRMLPQVVRQVLLAGERLLAELAAVRRVARVDPKESGKYIKSSMST